MTINRKFFEVSKNIENLVINKSEPSLLSYAPDGIAQHIGSYLTGKDKNSYINSCKTLYNFFIPNIDKKLVEKLLHHAAFAEIDKVKEMLKNIPRLLYMKGIVKDPCGRTLEGTAYRIALGAKDVSIGKYQEMVEIIEEQFQKLQDGEQEMQRQREEQFPPGYEDQEAVRAKQDSAELKKIFAAIYQPETGESYEKSIKEFHAYLKKQCEGIITSGYHFNEKLLIEAYELYDENFKYFPNHEDYKNRLAATKVIGAIQQYLPECDVQAYCQGLEKVVKSDQPHGRTSVVENHQPFRPKEFVKPYFIWCYKETGGMIGHWLNNAKEAGLEYFSKLMVQKNEALATKIPSREIKHTTLRACFSNGSNNP